MSNYAGYLFSLKGQKGSLSRVHEQDSYTLIIGPREVAGYAIEEVGQDYVVIKHYSETIVIPLNLFVVHVKK